MQSNNNKPTKTPVELLQEYISANNLVAGEKLPGERELSVILGLSRSALRETLKSYENMGLIERKPNFGTVLKELNVEMTMQLPLTCVPENIVDLDKLLEARIVVGMGVVPIIVAKASQEALEQFVKFTILNDEVINSIDDLIKCDFEFHRSLLALSESPYLISFCSVVNQYFFNIRSSQIKHFEERVAKNSREHLEIATAIKLRNVIMAQNAIYNHLMNKSIVLQID